MKKAVIAMLSIALAINLFTHTAIAHTSRAALAPAQTTEAILHMMPDFNGVIIINVAQLNAKLQTLPVDKAELVSKVQSLLDRITLVTGLDARATEQIVIGFSIGEAPERSQAAVMISGVFNQEQILARLTQMSGRAWKAKKYNGQRIYVEAPKNGKNKKSKNNSAALSFLDNQSLIAFGSVATVKKVMNARAGDQPNLAQNTTLMAALNHINGNAPIQFAFTVPDAIRQKLASATGSRALLRPLAAITEIRGTVELTDEALLADIAYVTGSEKEAGDVVGLINRGLAFAKGVFGNRPAGELIVGILNGVTASQSGNEARISANIPADLIRKILEEIQEYTNKVPRP